MFLSLVTVASSVLFTLTSAQAKCATTFAAVIPLEEQADNRRGQKIAKLSITFLQIRVFEIDYLAPCLMEHTTSPRLSMALRMGTSRLNLFRPPEAAFLQRGLLPWAHSKGLFLLYEASVRSDFSH